VTLNTTQGGDSKGDQDGRTVRLCSGAGIHVAAFTQNPQCQSAQQQQVRPKTSASCISGPAASPSSSRIMARERWRRIMLPPPPHPQRSSAVFKAAQYSCLRSMPDAVFRGRQPVSLAAYGLCCRMHHCFCALGTNNLSEPPQDHSAQRSTRKFLFGLKDLFFCGTKRESYRQIFGRLCMARRASEDIEVGRAAEGSVPSLTGMNLHEVFFNAHTHTHKSSLTLSHTSTQTRAHIHPRPLSL